MIHNQVMLPLLLLLANLTTVTPTPVSSMMEKPRLQSIGLYYSPRCPYSRKVLSYIREKKLAIPLHNVLTDPEAKEQLKLIGGYAIVPCLVVNQTAIYNSGEIIAWLADHDDQLPKNPS